MNTREPLLVFQDGADFYNETIGLLWTAPIRVLDWDTKAAIEARRLFLVECAVQGLKVELVGP